MAATVRVPTTVFLATNLGLDQKEVTFAEIAKESGYETALIGELTLQSTCHTKLSLTFCKFMKIT